MLKHIYWEGKLPDLDSVALEDKPVIRPIASYYVGYARRGEVGIGNFWSLLIEAKDLSAFPGAITDLSRLPPEMKNEQGNPIHQWAGIPALFDGDDKSNVGRG